MINHIKAFDVALVRSLFFKSVIVKNYAIYFSPNE